MNIFCQSCTFFLLGTYDGDQGTSLDNYNQDRLNVSNIGEGANERSRSTENIIEVQSFGFNALAITSFV